MKVPDAAALLNKIKILAIQAMFSDDDLLEQLVLKGGNAMALVHQISARASVDLDFSLKQDFGDDVADAEARMLISIQKLPTNPQNVEVLSWDKILRDVQMRNRIFFHKLGLN